MSFHSTIDKTLTELNKHSLNLKKLPTKYLLSLYKRTRKHINKSSCFISDLIPKYNKYNEECMYFNENFKSPFTPYEEKIIQLSNFNDNLKNILSEREHVEKKQKNLQIK